MTSNKQEGLDFLGKLLQILHLTLYLSFQLKFILKNSQFILEVLMSKIEQMYKSRTIPFPSQLVTVNGEYRRLKTIVTNTNKK